MYSKWGKALTVNYLIIKSNLSGAKSIQPTNKLEIESMQTPKRIQDIKGWRKPSEPIEFLSLH